MTESEKVAHLLRRFGLGASIPEMEVYGPLGVQGTLDKLINFPIEADTIHPFRFAYNKKGDAEPGAYRFRLHWLYHFVTTKAPLRERLSLLWHDHFAASDIKTEDGLAMLEYIQTIRANPAGKFKDILSSMAKSPAVMKMLDVKLMTKAVPNENFARELLELHTLGVGHYSEQDIKAIAQALTGWICMDTYYEFAGDNKSKLDRMHAYNAPYTVFAYAPHLHAEGPKTVLGKTIRTGDEVMELLGSHPQTARFVTAKMWEYFAYKGPEPHVLDRLVKKWTATHGDIKEILREIAAMPEFWSDKCVRGLIKSPMSYMIGLCRAMTLDKVLEPIGRVEESFNKPVPDRLLGALNHLAYFGDQLGQELYNPPSVKGWDWHEGWISTNTLMRRHQFTVPELYIKAKENGKDVYNPLPTMQGLLDFVKAQKPTDAEQIASAVCRYVDCPLSPSGLAVLAKLTEKRGGMKAINDARDLGHVCNETMNLLRSSPEFQLC